MKPGSPLPFALLFSSVPLRRAFGGMMALNLALSFCTAQEPNAPPPDTKEQAPEGKEIVLRWKWRDQKALRFETRFSQIVEMAPVGEDGAPGAVTHATDLQVRMTLDWKVQGFDADNRVAQVLQTVESLSVEYADGKDAAPLKWESASGGASEFPPAFADFLAQLHGSTWTLLIDDRGQVQRVFATDETAKRLQDAEGESPLSHLLDASAMARWSMLSMPTLPLEPATPGQNWQEERQIAEPILGRPRLQTTYRYEGPDDKSPAVERLTFSSSLLIPADQPAAAKVEVLEQASEGEVMFDRQSGRLVSAQTESSRRFSIVVGTSKFESRQETTTRLELSGGDDAAP